MSREGAWDHRHQRPWFAEPMNPERPRGPWQVSCPSKSGSGRDLVQTHLSQGDALAIARGGNTWPTLESMGKTGGAEATP